MANGKNPKWPTSVDQANKNIPIDPGLKPKPLQKWSTEVDKAILPGVLGTNQTSGVLDSTGQNWFDKLKSGLGNFLAQGAENGQHDNKI